MTAVTDADHSRHRLTMPDLTLNRGDARDELRHVQSDSVDLIFTSPPYAERRKSTYGGVRADEYVHWFLQISEELYRVLKPSGTFVLNIKEHAANGERNTYVIELILALRQQGWLWTEEFIWHKKYSYPGKWPNRFRDAWERLLQFNLSQEFKMTSDAMMIPSSEQTGECPESTDAPSIGNGDGDDVASGTNVLHLATEIANRGHSATFPGSLPTWFIQRFTDPGDTVLDPFLGSGTTAFAAMDLGRNPIGVEINPDYCDEVERNAKRRPRKLL